MLTPPYHFSIAACPLEFPRNATNNEILYRGPIPAARNIPFVRRLRLRTIVYLRKKQLKEEDGLVQWSRKRGIELNWVRVEAMGEESLGMGKSEVGEVLKIILNPSVYPLYLADIDGISHTTLVVACLRKLQGWHHDSIVNEICRFEPDHEDLPLIPFITSYLASSESSLTLPPPPYPTWLWPTASNSTTSPPLMKPIFRERTISAGISNTFNNALLPFPHPMTARKHPTMRLVFPAPPIMSPPLTAANNFNSLSRISSYRERPPGEENQPILIGNGGDDEVPGPGKMSGVVTFSRGAHSVGSTSPEKPEILPTHPSLPVSEEDNAPEDGTLPPDDELEVEDEEDYEEDEEEEEVQPTSQYISALDLAGFG